MSTFVKSRAFLVAVACLAGLLWHSAASGLPRCAMLDRWVRVSTPRFRLYGNLPSDSLVGYARTLEAISQALYSRGGALRVEGDAHINVYVFSDEDCYHTFQSTYRGRPVAEAGHFIQGATGGIITFHAGDASVVCHEYVHALVKARVDTLPVCVNEGLAEYFSTFQLAGNVAEYGHPIEEHLATLHQHAPIPMSALFAIHRDSPEYRTPGGTRHLLYAESWALIHYLMRYPDGRQRLDRLIGLLAKGESADGAIRTVYPEESWSTLHEQLVRYVDSSAMSYRRLDLTGILHEQPVHVEGLSSAEGLERLGLLQLGQGTMESTATSDGATTYFREALAVDSTLALARIGLGVAAARAGRVHEAMREFRAGIAGAGDDFDANLLAGTQTVALWRGGRFGAYDPRVFPEPLLWARKCLARCVRLDPQDVDALIAYGQTFVFERVPNLEGAEPLARALRARPNRLDLATDLVKLLGIGGQVEQACGIFERYLRPHPETDEFPWAQSELAVDAEDQVEKLARAGRRVDAESLVVKVARSLTPGQRDNLEMTLDRHDPARRMLVDTTRIAAPDSIRYFTTLGSRCTMRGDYGNARKWWKRALAGMEADSAQARMLATMIRGLDCDELLTRAFRLQRQGRNAEARRVLETLERMPLDPIRSGAVRALRKQLDSGRVRGKPESGAALRSR